MPTNTPPLWITKPPLHATQERNQHNHRAKINRLCAAGKIPVVPGSVNSIAVVHDDWCAIFAGGFCNCDPDIRVNGRLIK